MIRVGDGGIHVEFAAWDAAVERAYSRRFAAYGYSADCSGAQVGSVSLEKAFHSRDTALADGWRLTSIHGATPSEQHSSCHVMVTQRPLAITAINRPSIRVLQCEGVPQGHLLHMIKYPLRCRLEQESNILAHASGVVNRNGRCVLFLGAGGSGKSTVFAELVIAGLAAVANDSILLRRETRGTIAKAWPHVIRIGAGTLQAIPALKKALKPERVSYRDGKSELFADELDEVLERTTFIAGEHLVGRIIFPRIVVGGDEWIVEAHSGENAGRLIHDALVNDRFQHAWAPGWEWQEDLDARRLIARDLASRCGVISVTFGTDRHSWRNSLIDLVELG